MFANARGEPAAAARHCQTSLDTLTEIDDAKWIFKPLAWLAAAAAHCVLPETAARLLPLRRPTLVRTREDGKPGPRDQATP